MLNLILSLLLFLSDNAGCGDSDEPDIPTPPGYSQSGQSDELKKRLAQKTTGLLDVPYEDWLSRFTVGEEPLASTAAGGVSSLIKGGYAPKGYEDYLKRFDIAEPSVSATAVSGIEGLMGAGYAPTSYEDYLKRFTPETSPLMTGVLSRYQDLLGETYGMDDYTKTEQDYLDMVTRKYKESRAETLEPLKERYIAEGLFESGPGFKAEREFGEETAEGVSDITKQWAYEGIQRQEQAKQYQDALKRGDYQTMYNLALSEEQRKMQPVMQATEMANAEKQYYDALQRGDLETAFNVGQTLRQSKLGAVTQATSLEQAEKQYYDALQRGDLETAFNIGQTLRQNKLYPVEQATQMEMGAISPAMSLYGELSQEDLAKYQADLAKWQTLAGIQGQPQQKQNLSGLGAGLGMLAGYALAPATGGASAALMPALIGGGLGGGLGSIIQY